MSTELNITDNLNINRLKQLKLRNIVRDSVLISIGVLSAGLGLKGFLLPSHFLDGGVTGISLLVTRLTGVGLSILLVLINIPFILLGFKQVGSGFAIKTAIAIVALATVIEVVPYPVVTEDKLLIAVFGGFFLGAGIGFAMRGGCVIDGTEVAAIYIARKAALSVGDIILVFNIFIFGAAAIIVNMEIALYAILTYFSASRTIDFIIQGIEEYTGVTIISDKSEEIRKMIIEKWGKGVTVYKGQKGYGKRGEDDQYIDILFSVITRLELSKITNEVEKIDPHAFIVHATVNDSKGGMVKKRPLH